MSTATKSQVCPFEEVAHHADQIKNDGEHSPIMETGDAWPQGDVLIIKLAELPADNMIEQIKSPEAQLAPGNTQGSRHCLRHMDGVKAWKLKQGTVLDGPILELSKDNAVDHPEHGNVLLKPGTYSIVYQRAMTMTGFADQLARALD